MKRLDVIVLAPWLPAAELLHAGGLHVWTHVRELAEHAHVTVVAPAGAPGSIEGVDVRPVRVDRPSGRLAQAIRYMRWVRQGLGPGPDELRQLRSRLAAEPLRAVLARADVIEVQFAEMLPVVDCLPSHAPVVLWAHDVASDDLRDATRTSANFRRRWESALRRRAAERVERSVLPRCAGAVVFKAADGERLRDLGLIGPVLLAAPHLASAPSQQPDREVDPVVLVVASFARQVNRDGLQWLVERVWPGVVDSVPGARLRVVGAGAPPIAAHGVEVAGFVADLAEEYARAAVAVVPTAGGAGLKFTLAQALAAGVPVVSTVSGARGYDAPEDAGFLRRHDDVVDFRAAIVDILASADRGRALGAAGAEWWRQEVQRRSGTAELLAWYNKLAVR